MDRQPSTKVSSHENLDQSGNVSAFVRRLRHKMQKWRRFARVIYMQLRTSTEAIDYINTTRIPRKQRIDES